MARSFGDSSTLRRRLSVFVPALLDACDRLTAHPQFPHLFPDFLFLLHTITRAAVPLMVDAVEQLQKVGRRDPLAEDLIEYFEEHTVEEDGHDEWILADLEVLGVDRKEVLGRVPSPTVAGLAGAQYYWIRHYHPVALLGYIAVLEGSPPKVESVGDLARRSGLPPAAFRTLREHAALDGEHKLDLERLVDDLPLTREQFTLVCVNAAATVRSLVQCVDELIEEFVED